MVQLVPTKQEPLNPFVGVRPSYFAEVDATGTVLRVIVADQAFINSGAVGDPNNWIQSSMDNSIRHNGAGKGYTYDKKNDAFIPPRPSLIHVLDTQDFKWKLPAVDFSPIASI